MSIQQTIAARLEQLGWSEYKLTQEVCRLRGEPIDQAQRYYSSIRKCVNDPDNCKWRIVADIIAAMDGANVIRWNNPEEVEV